MTAIFYSLKQSLKAFRQSYRAKLSERCVTLYQNQQGIAAVEFAIILPLLLTIILGAVEVTHVIWARGKLHSATATVADLVSRENSLKPQEFEQLMSATPFILQPLNYRNAETKVISLIACEGEEFYVHWSQSWSPSSGSRNDTPYSPGQLYEHDTLDNLQIQEGYSIIFVENEFTYLPYISYILGTSVHLEEVAFYQPRYTKTVEFKKASGPPGHSRAPC